LVKSELLGSRWTRLDAKAIVIAMDNIENTSSSNTSTIAEHSALEPAVVLSSSAISQVKHVIEQQGFEGFYLTVRVIPAGCSGLGYDVNLLKEAKPGDTIWTQEGIVIATDELSKTYLKGTIMNWVKTDTSAGFKFENPNAKSNCGCGSSFSA
jgi:iron-sulfur cluster assembly protein